MRQAKEEERMYSLKEELRAMRRAKIDALDSLWLERKISWEEYTSQYNKIGAIHTAAMRGLKAQIKALAETPVIASDGVATRR